VRISARARAIAALVAAFLAAIVCWIPSASADTVPFTDPNASGSIGFCDKSGNEVRSGTLTAAPFAWIAVSSAAAPSGYGPPHGKATLYAFQPIQYVDPGNWSGKAMSAGSAFTNNAHPMTAGTILDPSLSDFAVSYPPHWNGLVQLRMYFGAPRQPQSSASYPTAVLRISGKTWTLISGGNVPCNAGTATSEESVALTTTAFKGVKRPAPAANIRVAGIAPGSSASGGSTAAGTGTGNATSVDPSAVAAAHTTKSGGSSSAVLWIVLAAVVVGIGGVTTVAVRSRRSKSS
jgi:hypothetical protein